MKNTTTKPRPRKFDAHVRARKNLVNRVVRRAYEWRVHRTYGPTPNISDIELRDLAHQALARYTWPGLTNETATIPAHHVHRIMCIITDIRREERSAA